MSLTTYLILALMAAVVSAYVMFIQSEGGETILPPLMDTGDGGDNDGMGSGGPPPVCTSMIDEASCVRTPGPEPYGGRCHWRNNSCSDGTIIPDIGAYSAPNSRTVYVHSLDRNNGILVLSNPFERVKFHRTALNTYLWNATPEEAMTVTIDWEKGFTYEIVQNDKVVVTRSYTRGV